MRADLEGERRRRAQLDEERVGAHRRRDGRRGRDRFELRAPDRQQPVRQHVADVLEELLESQTVLDVVGQFGQSARIHFDAVLVQVAGRRLNDRLYRRQFNVAHFAPVGRVAQLRRRLGRHRRLYTAKTKSNNSQLIRFHSPTKPLAIKTSH